MQLRVRLSVFRMFLLCLAAILTLFCMPFSQVSAATVREVPVTITLDPLWLQYNLDEEVTIEAVTKKEGDTYEVEAFIDSYDGEQEIDFKTELVNGKYVSKAVFSSSEIGTYKLSYKITMYGKNKMWVGTASKDIRVDNMPPAAPSIDGRVVISPSKNLEVGEKIRITAYVPNKGEIIHEDVFIWGDRPFKDEEIQNVKIRKSGRQYIMTGEFTPKKGGEYLFFFSLTMRDKDGLPIEGIAELEFEVKDNGNIMTSISPNTASMKVGEDIYLLFTYYLDEDAEHSVEFNLPVEDIFTVYNSKAQAYQKLVKFTPDKKKTYTFEATVEQKGDGGKREGSVKTRISVR